MATKALAFTMYPVTDMPRAHAFYRDALGLPPGEVSSEHWIEYELDGGTFGIGDFPQVGVPGTAQSLALEIADLAAFRKTLLAADIETGETHELGNCRISVVRDPDGNQIWLHERKA